MTWLKNLIKKLLTPEKKRPKKKSYAEDYMMIHLEEMDRIRGRH